MGAAPKGGMVNGGMDNEGGVGDIGGGGTTLPTTNGMGAFSFMDEPAQRGRGGSDPFSGLSGL
jgi:hypothetical protein